jgi:formylglycine-generating enzyme required for sulfatase activity
MNLTSQYIANPKSRVAYIESLATYKSIRTTSTRLRLSDDRCILKPNRSIYFKIDNTYFKMIRCPRGRFMMGSDYKSEANPKRPMVIERPFLLGETEVTQELFEKIMGYNPSKFQGGNYPNSKQRPVEYVTWYDAVMFCNKLSLKLGKKPYYNISNEQHIKENDKTVPNIKSANVTTNPQANGFRLPYEKEWEYAAKAGTDNKYAGANDDIQLREVAWFNEDFRDGSTHLVAKKKPNEWGFYDMSGNVDEWCYDLYKATLDDRVVRGGGWSRISEYSRSANRNDTSPGDRCLVVGFRVSASLVN